MVAGCPVSNTDEGNAALPARRVVVRVEFFGAPASFTKFRVLWLVLDLT